MPEGRAEQSSELAVRRGLLAAVWLEASGDIFVLGRAELISGLAG